MVFEEVLEALRDGKKIRRTNNLWVCTYGFIKLRKVVGEDRFVIVSGNAYGDRCEIEGKDVYVNEEEDLYAIKGNDLYAIDWEIVKEKKKVKLRDLTKKQFINWVRKNCLGCKNCIFKGVECNLEWKSCWIKHKDLYSDKFLDQEIEIEEE